MYSFFKKNKKNFQELLKTYVVGVINLIVGLSLTYIFQFFVFQFISFPLRTYLTNVTSFSIGVPYLFKSEFGSHIILPGGKLFKTL